VGLSGKDANMIVARKLTIEGGRDLGYVGEVEAIDPEVIRLLDSKNFTPVISPIGVDRDGQTYNINADTVAAEIAIALKATKLILLTDIRGICRDPRDVGTLIHRIRGAEVEALVADGTVRGGMIPKVRACAAAIEAGVGSVHILDGRLPHSLLIEMFTDMGIGTMIH
jgi:acetylglutamate kinase